MGLSGEKVSTQKVKKDIASSPDYLEVVAALGQLRSVLVSLKDGHVKDYSQTISFAGHFANSVGVHIKRSVGFNSSDCVAAMSKLHSDLVEMKVKYEKNEFMTTTEFKEHITEHIIKKDFNGFLVLFGNFLKAKYGIQLACEPI